MLKKIFRIHYKLMFYIGNILIKKSYPLNHFGSYLINSVLTQNLKLDLDRKSTRLNSSHSGESRMPSSA